VALTLVMSLLTLSAHFVLPLNVMGLNQSCFFTFQVLHWTSFKMVCDNSVHFAGFFQLSYCIIVFCINLADADGRFQKPDGLKQPLPPPCECSLVSFLLARHLTMRVTGISCGPPDFAGEVGGQGADASSRLCYFVSCKLASCEHRVLVTA
jgi:hypothetical protein